MADRRHYERRLIDRGTPDRRRRGRPVASEPGSSVSVHIQARYHDRLIALANQRDVSVSTFLRGLIIRIVESETPKP